MVRAILVALLTLVGGNVAHAQFSASDPLLVTISPEYPRPYEVVTVTPSSTLVNLAGATIKVYVDGSLLSTFSGVESIPVTLGGPGKVTTVLITATVGGKTYRKQVPIATGDVSLVTEAVATAHPFYKGGLLVPSQGRLRLVALADLRTSGGTRLDPSKLVYTWKFGNQILESDSGIGKNVLTATAPVRYRDAQISVIVQSESGALVGQASALVSPVDPVLRIYPFDPLLGIDFNHALTGVYEMKGTEESLRAVPYFFATKPTFSWSVNGQESGTSNTVTVRSTGSGNGRANLSLSTRLSDTNQSATKSLSVLFGSQPTLNIFGF